MTIAVINRQSVTSGQTREEIRATYSSNWTSDVWQGFISNSATLSNAPNSALVELGDLLKTQYNNSK